MAKRNLLNQMLTPTASVGRNAFDLSQGHKFSALAGQCIPVFCEDVMPGDYFDIDSAIKCRTLPFNTAAWFDCKVNFDFFFVPYWQIWSLWPQFIYEQLNAKSSLQTVVGSLAPSYQPQVALTDLIQNAYTFRKTTGLGMVKLLDMLGYGAYYDVVVADDEQAASDLSVYLENLAGKYVSPFRLAAYRKCWHDYYVQKWRDPDSANTIKTFNYDYLNCTTFNGSRVPAADILQTQLIRQAPYRKDLFTASLPSRQYGAVSAFNVTGDLIANSGTSQINFLKNKYNSDGSPSPVGLQINNTVNTSPNVFPTFTIENGVDVYAIKQAYAMQKWKEAHMRAGNRVRSQQMATFGVDSDELNGDLVTHLGGFDMQVMIDDIRSTEVGTPSSERPNGYLGELGGTGIGYASHSGIKFSVKDHGVIMCIASAIPRFDYNAYGIDRQVVRSTPLDYFNPKFDNLGLSPITSTDYCGSVLDADSQNNVIGYAPAYFEYKTRIDKVHMSFMEGKTNQHYAAVREVFPEFDGSSLPTSFFYIQPSLLNNVFMVNANPADMATDQFLFDAYFDIKAVRPMSKLGLCDFN